MSDKSEYKIEKNVDMPTSNASRSQYPFHLMEVGDSFAVSLLKRTGVSSSARAWGERQEPSWKFTTRVESEDTLRVWRVE